MTGFKEKIPERDQKFDTEYIGNPWGWKFSLFGLVLILGLVLAMWYRHSITDSSPGFERTESPVEKIFDK